MKGDLSFINLVMLALSPFKPGNPGDALLMPTAPCCGGAQQAAINMSFSTYDADHDTSSGNCAELYSGAWWYGSCHSSNLNGLYLNGTNNRFAAGDVWCPWTGYEYPLKTVEMKIKPYHENADCQDVQWSGATASGTYTVAIQATNLVNVSCDMVTSGGGWLVFQRRMDGSENFYRGWNDYVNGFGKTSGELWLGLENLHQLTANNRYRLRVDMTDFNGQSAYAEYDNFVVDDAASFYTLSSVGQYSGTAGDALIASTVPGCGGVAQGALNMPFTTYDANHNPPSAGNCAVAFQGAWWYGACHISNLNGLYLNGTTSQFATGDVWCPWRGYYYALKTVEMKIRPYYVVASGTTTGGVQAPVQSPAPTTPVSCLTTMPTTTVEPTSLSSGTTNVYVVSSSTTSVASTTSSPTTTTIESTTTPTTTVFESSSSSPVATTITTTTATTTQPTSVESITTTSTTAFDESSPIVVTSPIIEEITSTSAAYPSSAEPITTNGMTTTTDQYSSVPSTTIQSSVTDSESSTLIAESSSSSPITTTTTTTPPPTSVESITTTSTTAFDESSPIVVTSPMIEEITSTSAAYSSSAEPITTNVPSTTIQSSVTDSISSTLIAGLTSKKTTSGKVVFSTRETTTALFTSGAAQMSSSTSTVTATVDTTTSPTKPQPFIETVSCINPSTDVGAFMSVIVSRDRYGSFASYACPRGFSYAEGGVIRVLTCTDGTWADLTPTCRPIQCTVDDDVALSINSSLDDEFAAVGSLMSGSCGDAERFEDGLTSHASKCVERGGNVGIWTVSSPSCSPYRCIPAPYVENAVGVLNQSTRSTLVTCLPGHRFPDGHNFQTHYCKADGTWDRIYNCEVIFCPALHIPANGAISTTEVVYNTVVVVTCDVGFRQPDGRLAVYVLCTDGAEWNDTFADCQPVYCNATSLPFVSNAAVSQTSDGNCGYGTAVSYTCSTTGSRFEDGTTSTSVICSDDGTWRFPSAVVTSCGHNRCPPVPVVPNAEPDSRLALNNTTVRYTCSDGFTLNSSSPLSVVCQSSLQWSTPSPQCQRIRCPKMLLNHFTVNDTDTRWGTTVHVLCDSGYLADGQPHLVTSCSSSGNWLPDPFRCLPVDCGVPSMIPNADFSAFTTTTFLSALTYSCTFGHWFENGVFTYTSTCQANSIWSLTQYYNACVPIRCPTVLFRQLSSTDTLLGSIINVSCPIGLHLTSISNNWLVTVCSKTGEWVPAIPSCVEQENSTSAVKPTEAKRSTFIGVTMLAIVIIPLILLVLSDIAPMISKSPCFNNKGRPSNRRFQS